jgi:hypothetical protein
LIWDICYNRNPNFELHRACKFETGLSTILLNVELDKTLRIHPPQGPFLLIELEQLIAASPHSDLAGELRQKTVNTVIAREGEQRRASPKRQRSNSRVSRRALSLSASLCGA